jgi:formylglycine-generating enzyme required for sulfatase activity
MGYPTRPWTIAARYLSLLAAAFFAFAAACSTTSDDANQTTVLADGGHSLPDHCTDGQKDDGESDVDCGGGTCAACTGNKACSSGTDCSSTVCQANDTCTFASDTDGIKNGSETDVDCGGDVGNPRCASGKTCLAGSDCTSLVCGANKTCSAPTATDGVKNGGETDVDCGGGPAPAAPPPVDGGTPVDAGADAGVRKKAPLGGIVRGDLPADVTADGGPTSSVPSDDAPACAEGKACLVNGDCASLACAPTTKTCVPATAMDGFKDGSETDVDCGGSGGAPPCASGDACVGATDCTSGVCTKAVCAVATSSDGVKNEGETDTDCGGPNAPSCPAGKACAQHADCSSNGCDDTMHCALAPSCTQAHGGYSCGAGETGDPNAKHESCCTALPVTGYPSGDFLLDKYVITAGRMRQFIDRNNGNVRAWIQAHYPPGWDPTWDGWLPGGYNDGAGDASATGNGVYTNLGPVNYGTFGGGNEGCFVTGPGARSYWLPANVNATFSNDLQQYSQEILDEKAQNCVTAMMLMAFCAWDGGRLATNAELDYAWHGGDASRTYPWGKTPIPAGYPAAYGDMQGAQGHQSPASGDVTIAAFSYNYWNPTELAQNDQTVYIPAPGRFTRNVGPFGHLDLAGVAMEITATLTGATGQDPTNRGDQWSIAGSWEGHPIGTVFSPFPMTNKYLAATGRCAR